MEEVILTKENLKILVKITSKNYIKENLFITEV